MSHAPPAAPRRAMHLRRIYCEGFAREDGLFDIEGVLIDTKPAGLRLLSKQIAPNAPIHQMRVRITIDRERRIVDAAAFSEEQPYRECAEVEANYRRLIGLTLDPGFTREVKRLFRGTAGCSHITELLPPMASTAFQVLWAEGGYENNVDAEGSARRTSPLGGCHALRLDGEIVRTYFPQHAKEPE